MEVFIFAQTLYYFVVSISIIVFGALSLIITYRFVCIAKHLQHISDNIDGVSGELKESIEEIIENLSSLPIFSLFLKKNSKHKLHTSGKKRS